MTVYGYSKYFECELPLAGVYERPYKTRYGTWDTYEVPIYYDALDAVAAKIRKRTEDEYQTMAFVSGSTGSGKSNIGVMLCRAIEPHWDVEENYILNKKKLFTKVLDEDGSKVVLIDEGSLMLNSKNGMRNDDKSIEQLFDIIRSWSRVTVICAPDENRVNHSIVETHVDIMLKVPERSPIPGIDRRGFVDLYETIRRDWGKPSYGYKATLLVDKMGPRVGKRYADVKKRTQREFLISELAKCE